MAAASFVTEVLAKAGKLEKEDISGKLSRLERRIEEVKVELFDALEKKYADFYPYVTSTVQLNTKVTMLSEEMQATSNKIEKEIQNQLKSSTSEFQDVSSQLVEANALMKILGKLLSIHESLQMTNKLMSQKEYEEAVSRLELVSELLQEQMTTQDSSVAMLQTLENEYAVVKEKLIQTLREMWREHIKWSLPHDNGDSNTDRTELTFLTSDENQKVLKGVINAMNHLNLLDDNMKLFCERLLNHLICPLLSSTEATLTRTCTDQEAVITVTSPAHSRLTTPISPPDAFEKLGTLFQLLEEYILGITINNDKSKDNNVPGHTLLHLVGQHVGGATVDLIIKHCLANSIPTSNRELKNYHEVINITGVFQTKLHSLGFIAKENTLLTDYVNNVNVLFANKKSQEILQKARDLMTTEIHNMVEVTADSSLGSLGSGEGTRKKAKTSDNMALKSDSQLHAGTFRMPNCMISVWTEKLVLLAYETLQEATTSSAACAIQLFYSVRNVFELFCNVVPTYHKDQLEKLPQLAALHHNNCMYIAHHLLTLGHQYRHLLPDPLKQGASTFVDLVPRLRRLGTECFLQQMTQQKTQLLQCLRSANGFYNVSEDQNFLTAERAIKQTLHQLVHLSKVWKNVLPANVYCKSIGTLLNSVTVEVVGCMTSLEDISADDAVQLHSLLKFLSEKVPDLFVLDSAEENADKHLNSNAQLLKCVPKWTKLQELMIILMSSLQDISDRWLDGKGPLAHHFSSNEIKQLIRALFQNTERRANILARIR